MVVGTDGLDSKTNLSISQVVLIIPDRWLCNEKLNYKKWKPWLRAGGNLLAGRRSIGRYYSEGLL